eukprot:m.39609 g.39609  ORF g.39609 m.39609 type:complete len:66 (+) comp10333_c0_seq2:292-489(+)
MHVGLGRNECMLTPVVPYKQQNTRNTANGADPLVLTLCLYARCVGSHCVPATSNETSCLLDTSTL